MCRCKWRCKEINSQTQQQIFDKYWGLEFEDQRMFLIHHVQKIEKKIQKTGNKPSRRGKTLAYHLPVEDELVRVCSKGFYNTLDISEKTIRYRLDKGLYSTKDRRGKHVKKQIPEKEKNYIREHIKQFPKVPSHFCRKDVQRKYLDSNLSLKKMYRMYEDECKSKGRTIQKF